MFDRRRPVHYEPGRTGDTGLSGTMDVKLGVTAASSLAAVPCRRAAFNVGISYGIGHQIPQPVAARVNFFLTTFHSTPIKASGGISGGPVSVVNRSATSAAGSFREQQVSLEDRDKQCSCRRVVAH